MEFEEGYYIVDLFDVLDAKKKVVAEESLAELANITAQFMDKEVFNKYVSELQKQAGMTRNSKPKFDVEGFKALQRRLKSGL